MTLSPEIGIVLALQDINDSLRELNETLRTCFDCKPLTKAPRARWDDRPWGSDYHKPAKDTDPVADYLKDQVNRPTNTHKFMPHDKVKHRCAFVEEDEMLCWCLEDNHIHDNPYVQFRATIAAQIAELSQAMREQKERENEK